MQAWESFPHEPCNAPNLVAIVRAICLRWFVVQLMGDISPFEHCHDPPDQWMVIGEVEVMCVCAPWHRASPHGFARITLAGKYGLGTVSIEWVSLQCWKTFHCTWKETPLLERGEIFACQHPEKRSIGSLPPPNLLGPSTRPQDIHPEFLAIFGLVEMWGCASVDK